MLNNIKLLDMTTQEEMAFNERHSDSENLTDKEINQQYANRMYKKRRIRLYTKYYS